MSQSRRDCGGLAFSCANDWASTSASAKGGLLSDHFRFADKDEAAGAADATAWVSREISGAADIVWVIGKGDSCDPFTQNDAGGTPAS